MGRIGKNLAGLLRKTAIVSSFGIPVFFSGCKPDDTTPPEISVYSPLEQKVYDSNTIPLEWNIIEENFNSAWYSTNDGQTKTPLAQSGKRDLTLSNGSYNLILFADDQEENSSTSTVNFSVNKEIIDNIPPKITISSPLEQTFYDSNTIQFQWTIEEPNFKGGWYSLDTELTKRPLGQSGEKEFKLNKGVYKLIIFAEDNSNNNSKKEINFYISSGILMNIDYFISPDANGAAYNALTKKSDRDTYIQAKVDGDWVNTIPGSIITPIWVCGHYARQLMVNSRNLGDSIKMDDATNHYYLFNRYNGNNTASIKINGGTFYSQGDLGLPMGTVSLVDTSHFDPDFGHGINWVLTGDDITKWEDINFIEPQTDATNVQIGGWNIPNYCDEVIIDYDYTTKDDVGNYLRYVHLVKFRIENGKPILIWENTDPNFVIKKQRGK